MDILHSLDVAILLFFNRTLANPVGDMLWPIITNYDRALVIRILLGVAWMFLLVRGGRRGRTVALLLIPLLIVADQASSSVLKPLFDRARPCHTVDGVLMVPEVRLLVDCGPGKSFPSSHAVNNFAVAALFGFFYRRWWWAFGAWALLVSLSRVAVGVHYPSDVAGGAVIGVLLAAAVVSVWTLIERRFFPAPHVQERA